MFKNLWAKIAAYFRRKVAPEANRAIIDPLRPSMKAAVNKAADDVLMQSSLSIATTTNLLKSLLAEEMRKRGVPAWVAAAMVGFIDDALPRALAQETATRAVEYLRGYLLDRAGNARF
jgi:hypothetical protein